MLDPGPVCCFLLCSSLTSGSGLVDLLLARYRGSTANRKIRADVLLLDLLDVRGDLEGAGYLSFYEFERHQENVGRGA